MSGKSSLLKEEFEFAYNALERSLEGLDDEEYFYKIAETSNTIQAILYHLSLFTKHNIPSIIKGAQYSTQEAKIMDKQSPEYCFDKLLKEIVLGKTTILEGVDRLSDDDLEEVIPLMAGPYPRKIGLYAYLGELFHHKGQIAFIRGTIQRRRNRNSERTR